MENRHYEILSAEKRANVEKIKPHLQSWPNVLFTDLHGSFSPVIDLGILTLRLPAPSFLSSLQVKVEIEAEFRKGVKRYPVKVRVLSRASLSFRYSVIKHGEQIVVVDEELRCDFMQARLSHYFDFAPFQECISRRH